MSTSACARQTLTCLRSFAASLGPWFGPWLAALSLSGIPSAPLRADTIPDSVLNSIGVGSAVPVYVAPGDTNIDWTVDVLDVANLVASGKYSTGMPASWPEGDFNDDGVMDILDISDFVSTGLYNAGPYTGGEVIAPEPTAMGIAGAGACVAGWMAMRRKRLAGTMRRRRP